MPLPHPLRRRAALAATGLALAGVLSAPGGAGAETLDERKDRVEDRIDHAHDHVDESSAELQAATDALLAARADLAAAQARLAETRDQLAEAQAHDLLMQRRLDAAVERLRAARRELADGRAEVADQEEQVRRMVAATYVQGDPALLGLSAVFTSQDPAQIAGTLDAASSVVNVESSVLDRLEASKVMLQVEEEATEAAKELVARRRAEAAANLARMQALEQQAEEAEAQVASLVDLREQARANALRAKSADLKALAALQAERDRIEELIAEQASRGSGYTGPSDGNGFLSMPVDGYVTSPFGWRTHPIWGYRSLHDGVDYGSPCGTPIRAAANGVVLSTYYQSAYGNRIIVDHGVRYGVGVATISNHLSSYAVSEGERVRRGEVIGYVGDTGWSTGCHLHFTVLANGVAVDPMLWF